MKRKKLLVSRADLIVLYGYRLSKKSEGDNRGLRKSCPVLTLWTTFTNLLNSSTHDGAVKDHDLDEGRNVLIYSI